MDRYAVVGHPVEHSQSPFIHAEFARQTGEAMAYDRLHCPLDGFADAVHAFAASGARGCNVTVPFKFDAFGLARHTTSRARQAGAANVLRFDADGWTGDNTDGIGLVRDLTVNAGQPLTGRRLLLIGAGGAAAGVLGPLIEAAPAQIVVTNRTAARAVDLVESHADLARRHDVALQALSLDEAARPSAGRFAVLLNATASSLVGDAVPVPGDRLEAGALAVDLMYGPAAQGFLDWATAAGARPRDGLGMLVEQAAEAFWLWRGVRPSTADVLARLRERIARPAAVRAA
jgi:shikimate dehydrogenase